MHLYLHDYTFVDQVTDTLTGSMSMTAATFASVLIASQLKTQMQVFSQARIILAYMQALLICITVTWHLHTQKCQKTWHGWLDSLGMQFT